MNFTTAAATTTATTFIATACLAHSGYDPPPKVQDGDFDT